MAQIDVINPSSSNVSLTALELCEILEYEKIVQFCDSVLAGTHPRVKIPAQLNKPITLPNSFSSNDTSPTTSTNTSTKLSHPAHSPQIGEVMSANRAPNAQRSTGSRLTMSTNSKINPVLLEKSEDLIKAEIRLQRQRLERALKEQVEQQRVSTKTLLRMSESFPNFDVSEVLSKAHSIVQPCSAEDDPSAGAHSSASDSLDDNTFYSSQNDTPEPVSPSLPQKNSVIGPIKGANLDGKRSENSPKVSQGVVPSDPSQSVRANLSARDSEQNSKSTLYSVVQEKQSEVGVPNSSTLEETQRQENNSRMSMQNSMESKRIAANNENTPTSHPYADLAVSNGKNPTLGNNNESRVNTSGSNNNPSVIPQPAHISPPTTIERIIPPRYPATDEGQLAHISASRHEGIVLSTDSPPVGKDGENREVKNKRTTKDDRASNSPHIKLEPKSPPLYLPMARPPNKQNAQRAPEVSYDDRALELDHSAQERSTNSHREAWRPYERERRHVPVEYESRSQRFEGNDDENRRFNNGHYFRHPRSPEFATPYIAGEAYSRNTSVVAGRRPLEDSRIYREPMTRASVHPDLDRNRNRSRSPRRESIPMGPPRQPIRVLVNERGRQHYNHSPTSMRTSVAPMIRYRDDDLIYERLPPRIISENLPMKFYGDDDISSRRDSPTLAAPRRVISHPEYVQIPVNPRLYREREYSVRPTAINQYLDDYVSNRVAPDSRHMSHYEDSAHDYWPSSSIRNSSARYGAPVEYTGRLQSMRPEIPVDGIETRRDMTTQGQREYSIRPMDAINPRELPLEARYYEEVPTRRIVAREPSVYYSESSSRRPIEIGLNDGFRYEERHRRRPSNVEYIEEARVREPSLIVYGEDNRRDSYR